MDEDFKKFEKFCLKQKDMPEGTKVSLMAKSIQVVTGEPEEEEDDDNYGVPFNELLDEVTTHFWLPDKYMLIGFILPEGKEVHHFVDFTDKDG